MRRGCLERRGGVRSVQGTWQREIASRILWSEGLPFVMELFCFDGWSLRSGSHSAMEHNKIQWVRISHFGSQESKILKSGIIVDTFRVGRDLSRLNTSL